MTDDWTVKRAIIASNEISRRCSNNVSGRTMIQTYVLLFIKIFCCAEVVVCDDPGFVRNAGRSGPSGPNHVGTRVRYTCRTGYAGGGTITCQTNAQWTPRPTCSRGKSCKF